MTKLQELADLLEIDLEDLKGDKGDSVKGEKGDDYVLTEQDKKEIAAKIDVPIVERITEKVIERTEVIREQPIVTEITKITNEIKEVAILEKPEEIRNKLEGLIGGEKLSIQAIEGLEKKLNKPQDTSKNSWGARGIQLYIGGTKQGIAQTVNLIAGSGITLTYARASGRNDVTITAGASGITTLPATGAVNGTNTIFTFTEKPDFIISDGAWYRENTGWTWSVLTATMTIPPVSDIYGAT